MAPIATNTPPPTPPPAAPPVVQTTTTPPAAAAAGGSPAAAAAAAAQSCICAALFGTSVENLAQPLIAATIAQFAFGFLWYALIVNNAYVRSLAVDKGVKAVAFIKQRYSTVQCCVLSLLTGVFRAAAIVAVVHQVSTQGKLTCGLCVYSQAAVAVWLVQVLSYVEESLYAQRPLSLIGISVSYNLFEALIAATSLFFIKA